MSVPIWWPGPESFTVTDDTHGRKRFGVATTLLPT